MPVPHKFRRFAAILLAALSAAAAAEPSFVPVYRDNFPDPHVVLHGGEFIAYATNDGINVPMLVSRYLVNWLRVTDAAGRRIDGMPVLAPWVQVGCSLAQVVLRCGANWLIY